MSLLKNAAISSATIFLMLQSSLAQVKSAAEVNGVSITVEELNKTYDQSRFLLTNKIVTKEKVLNDLINRQLGINKAMANNLQKDPEVKRLIDDVLFNAQISRDLAPLLAKIPAVTKQDVLNYYKNNKEYRTAHILLRIPANASSVNIDGAFVAATDIYNQAMKSPAKFGELAKKYSQTVVAEKDGEVGYQPRILLPKEYYEAIDGQKIGFISKPVRTQLGYHVIKLLGVKAEKDLDQQMYMKIIYDTRRDPILEKYFSDLQKSAKITIHKEHLN